ncbi:hypothetical protein L228DRAFT_251624 [Xylona heveae TC161]|uniref:Uncharacterized protein n=1 Tax=Xylona heveae (strain CBS 132557 / TC161) TaxID=1328760 RepID=A0A164ZG45_XYLHT|nr:hypothetical protein L228DRAFT_251624 [Xylona heveae TC161]KZF19061.1 hypothetical protein L228DRAFT_251624 [Xylona heveae TC161]
MDSMRSLNTSLPQPSSPRPQALHPTEDLLQAFKSAALSVTNLYKTAAGDQAHARQEGYQDALDDLLSFLDKENLGLGDGEGWRVRQWATERLDGSRPQAGVDSDDERETDKPVRTSSPAVQRMSGRNVSNQEQTTSEPPLRTESAPPSTTNATHETQSEAQRNFEMFTFRSGHPYPEEIIMDGSQDSTETSEDKTDEATAQQTSAPSFTLEVLPRHNRPVTRFGAHGSRSATRPPGSSTGLGSGAGSKRRLPFGEFFDISSVTSGKEGIGSSKRGRFI